MASGKQIILITGANNGIGFDTSYALAAASPNNHIIMTARSTSKGEKALKDIQARSPQGSLSFLELDVTKDDSISAAAKKVESDFGKLDVLVNNAGIMILGPFTREGAQKTFETNVYGPMLLTEAMAPLLRKSKDPRVINVSSGLGSVAKRADPNDEHYGNNRAELYRISKAALNMLTNVQSFAFKDWGCKVWSYCPGFVVTDLSGAHDRERRKDAGADSSETSAEGIKEIVEGKRDGDLNKFIARYGETYPW